MGPAQEQPKDLIEELGGTHAKCMLYSRYVTFMQSISKHEQFPVKFILQLTRSSLMSVTELKKNLKFCRTEDENKWKVAMIRELVNVKQGTMCVENEDHEE